ncbi:MAG: hypothetical protein OHK93_005371 [Ramalina farinacea]|uniref:Uncharacterized protein n=1 Tax=Ramalina farinacea TaxID=258253 RepID=A0AA43R0C9_9LECA|nr:hypothetical protein [Ramalina farinacea]
MKYSNAIAVVASLATFYSQAVKARAILDKDLMIREVADNATNVITVATLDAGAPISVSGTAKRAAMAYSRIINLCPSTSTFVTSYCTRRTGQDYITRCAEDDDLSYSTQDLAGHCADTELCIDGITSPGHNPVAYCVSTHNFSELAKGQYGAGQQVGVRITLPDKGAITSNNAIEVVTAGGGGITEAYLSSHLKLEARDASDALLPGG